MLNHQVLADELTNDPLGRSYAAMTDEQATADLNGEYRTRLVPINTRQLLEWGAANRRLKRIEDNQTATNADYANLCRVASAMIRREDAELDMANPVHVAFVDSLVVGSILFQADKDDLMTLASQPQSRARELAWGRTYVKTADVQYARTL